MSHDLDRRTDSLLRGFARGESGASSNRQDGELHPAAAGDAPPHLDADALNLYAENALPPAARARYTAHLADCARCRADLIFVARAADVPAATTEKIVAPQPQPSSFGGWRKRFAALFAAPALRFGVPTFALLLVCAAIFFLTRTGRQDNALVASRGQRDEPALNVPAPNMNTNMGTPAANTPTLNANGNINSTATNMNSSQPPVESRAKAPASDRLAKSFPPTNANAPASTDYAYAPPPPPPAAAPRAPNEELNTARRPESSTPAPQTSTNAGDAVSVAGSGEVANSRSNTNMGLNRNSPESEESINVRRARQTDAANLSSAPAAPADERAPGRAASRAARKRPDPPPTESRQRAREQGDSVRTVAGRRFRRQNNVWIDADYNPSMSTTNVARGSEQFRALAADEPILRRIANELPGEVIIRINNRAYRIR